MQASSFILKLINIGNIIQIAFHLCMFLCSSYLGVIISMAVPQVLLVLIFLMVGLLWLINMASNGPC